MLESPSPAAPGQGLLDWVGGVDVTDAGTLGPALFAEADHVSSVCVMWGGGGIVINHAGKGPDRLTDWIDVTGTSHIIHPSQPKPQPGDSRPGPCGRSAAGGRLRLLAGADQRGRGFQGGGQCETNCCVYICLKSFDMH